MPRRGFVLLAPPPGELSQRVSGRAVTERAIPRIDPRPLSVAARQLSPTRGDEGIGPYDAGLSFRSVGVDPQIDPSTLSSS